MRGFSSDFIQKNEDIDDKLSKHFDTLTLDLISKLLLEIERLLYIKKYDNKY